MVVGYTARMMKVAMVVMVVLVLVLGMVVITMAVAMVIRHQGGRTGTLKDVRHAALERMRRRSQIQPRLGRCGGRVRLVSGGGWRSSRYRGASGMVGGGQIQGHQGSLLDRSARILSRNGINSSSVGHKIPDVVVNRVLVDRDKVSRRASTCWRNRLDGVGV